MPNWCYNKLTVSGDDAEVQRFVKENSVLDETNLTFEASAPTPPEEMERDGGYDYHCDEWGTKWDACDAVLWNEGGSHAEYRFNTAWAPPIFWLEKAVKKYPKLKFDLRYDEAGMDFSGRLDNLETDELYHEQRDWSFGGSF